MAKSEADYRAESDHRTLMEASQIQRDPARVKGVAQHHAKVQADIARVGKTLAIEKEPPAVDAAEEARLPKRRMRRMARRGR